MKRYSKSYIIRESQIKTIRDHYTPFRKAKAQNTTPSAGENMEQ